MAEHDELLELVRLAAPPFEVPAGLEDRVFAAIAPPRRRRRLWWRLAPLVPAAAAAAAVALFVVISGGGGERYELRGGAAVVNATVETTGVGREVTVDIERLRDPRPDGLYELWFVATDGRRRVSAGTFHPDDAGRGRVRLVAAADPKRYPRISVTLEPADGNPRRQGPTVLRGVRRLARERQPPIGRGGADEGEERGGCRRLAPLAPRQRDRARQPDRDHGHRRPVAVDGRPRHDRDAERARDELADADELVGLEHDLG